MTIARMLRRVGLSWLLLAGACGVHAHSASDAYLTLVATAARDGATRLEGRIDVALRDLDFALGLDADGNGQLTWGEVGKRDAAIGKFVFDALRASAGGAVCRLVPGRQQVATRADGAYAALFFTVSCPGDARTVDLDYRVLFALDPSHRGIVVFRGRGGTATALLSPAVPRITLDLQASPPVARGKAP